MGMGVRPKESLGALLPVLRARLQELIIVRVSGVPRVLGSGVSASLLPSYSP